MLGKIYCKQCEIGLISYAYIIGNNYYCSKCYKNVVNTPAFDIKKLYKKSVTKRVLKKSDKK
jgi:hypothetical protein